MSIEALYPSRKQSQRHNPLFARERRLQCFGVILGIGISVIGFLGLRIGLSATTAEAMGIDNGTVQISSALPAAHKHIRVIPLFKIPAETAAINHGAAER
jgi:hypothetical protein